MSEYAPDGRTSETIFAISGFSVGIQQGVATLLWVKTGKPRRGPAQVRFRDDIDDGRAEDRRKHLLASLGTKGFARAYSLAKPSPDNRVSFRPENVGAHYTEWPAHRPRAATFNGPVQGAEIPLIRIPAERGPIRMPGKLIDPEIGGADVQSLEARFMQSSGDFGEKKLRVPERKSRVPSRRRLSAIPSSLSMYAWRKLMGPFSHCSPARARNY